MAFGDTWVETDPDGDIITVSQLDDNQRLIKRAVRERLEGDPAIPDLTGLLEVGSFAAAPKPRKGAARVYVDTEANILAFDATKREDGRLGVASDTKHLFHASTAAVEEVDYVHRANGRQTITQIHILNPAITTGPQDISVSAGAGTFARAAGSYLDDGFLVGQEVTFSGFVNGGNNVAKIIGSVTATVITATDNTGLVTEIGDGDEVATLTGGAPFVVGANSIGELVAGFNADQLDGKEGADFLLVDGSNLTGITRVLGGSNVADSHTGDLVETTLKTLTVPGGSMKANGWLRITIVAELVGATANVTIRVKFGGSQVHSIAPAQGPFDNGIYEVWVRNINATNSQQTTAIFRNDAAAITPVQNADGSDTAVDTTVNQDVIVTVTLGAAGDTVTIDGFLVEAMPVA